MQYTRHWYGTAHKPWACMLQDYNYIFKDILAYPTLLPYLSFSSLPSFHTSLLLPTGVDVNAILELFGEQFFRNMKHSGHYRVIRCLGNTLEGFLLNLDALHDHFAIAYPKMRAPSFR